MNHDAFKTVFKYLTTFMINQYYDFSLYRQHYITISLQENMEHSDGDEIRRKFMTHF